jgi:hypothetical protein
METLGTITTLKHEPFTFLGFRYLFPQGKNFP